MYSLHTEEKSIANNQRIVDTTDPQKHFSNNLFDYLVKGQGRFLAASRFGPHFIGLIHLSCGGRIKQTMCCYVFCCLVLFATLKVFEINPLEKKFLLQSSLTVTQIYSQITAQNSKWLR